MQCGSAGGMENFGRLYSTLPLGQVFLDSIDAKGTCKGSHHE